MYQENRKVQSSRFQTSKFRIVWAKTNKVCFCSLQFHHFPLKQQSQAVLTQAGSLRGSHVPSESPSSCWSLRHTSSLAPWDHQGWSSPWRPCQAPAGATGRLCGHVGGCPWPTAGPLRSLGSWGGGGPSVYSSQAHIRLDTWRTPRFTFLSGFPTAEMHKWGGWCFFFHLPQSNN